MKELKIETTEEKKIKALYADVIVERIEGKPYYSIKYFDLEENKEYIGYSSYNLYFVFNWLDKYFDIIGDKGAFVYETNNIDIEPVSKEFLEDCKRTAEKYKKKNSNNDGWIPVENGLPDEGKPVIVWYEYFRYGDYNCMYQTYGIGYQYDGHWSGDVSGTAATCIAWSPLPEPYGKDGE